MELFTTADGIMGVFTKTIDKLEKHKAKKVAKSEELSEMVADLLEDRSVADAEVRKSEGYISGIKSMMNIKEEKGE